MSYVCFEQRERAGASLQMVAWQGKEGWMGEQFSIRHQIVIYRPSCSVVCSSGGAAKM